MLFCAFFHKPYSSLSPSGVGEGEREFEGVREWVGD